MKSLLILIITFALSSCFNTTNDNDSKNTLSVTGQCKPVENQCELLGSGQKIHLQFKAPPSYQRLLPVTVSSETSLSSVVISLIIDGKEIPSVKMKAEADKKLWSIGLMPFATVTRDNLKVHLKVSDNGNTYIAEFPVTY